jgi:hypothetical protein
LSRRRGAKIVQYPLAQQIGVMRTGFCKLDDSLGDYAATAANSAAEKRRVGGLFTIWQCAGAYRRIAAHQRCGRARIESPGIAPGLSHFVVAGKTMPVFGNSFSFPFHGPFLWVQGVLS